ncbi:MAG: hypothetical protein JRI23_34760, partial [Deltaproteobacteria bacterium]|nr:hypothetical protein [Deltaproteobacteria bacterium]MBW2537469.1 hypothetical protein [Deltaproteobacteria bacterium]
IGLSTGNRFYNNTVYNCEYLLNNQTQTDYAMDESNVFANYIFYDVGAYQRPAGTSNVTVSTSSFFNSFAWSGPGDGNVSIDPDFVDLVDFVPQASGLDGAAQAEYHYDYDGDQRVGYTMGAQERVQ